MPPPANAGSRGGLITAVVIFAVLFVTATIFAIYYGTQAAKAQEDYVALRDQIQPTIVRDPSLSSPQLAELDAVRRAGTLPGISESNSLMETAIAQRDLLARTLAGTGATAQTAAQAATQALSTIQAQLTPEGGQPIAQFNPQADVLGAARALADALVAKQQQLDQLQKQFEDLQNRFTQVTQAHTAAMQEKDRQIEQIRAQAERQIAEATNATNASRETIQQIEQTSADERSRLQQAMDQLNVQIAQREQERSELQAEIQALRRRLAPLRVDVNDPTLRQPDGQVISVPGNRMVYINLGQGDQIVPGMTFEVFDKLEGMPRQTEVDEAGDPIMPRGKAAIEVMRVGASSSEARVIRQDEGSVITQGDLIANLVYDKNTKYRFVVYGKFDLDNNEVPTAQDAEVIKRLVTQWGGQLMDRVTVDTDFVVLGPEPVLPEFTREELENNPQNMAKLTAAQQELDQYLDVVQRASELSIPILNQNRFLYFVGYYDQARR